jgi:hypothetical protein
MSWTQQEYRIHASPSGGGKIPESRKMEKDGPVLLFSALQVIKMSLLLSRGKSQRVGKSRGVTQSSNHLPVF